MNLFRQFSPLRRKAAIAASIMTFGAISPSIADDIDLYTGGEATTGAPANILFVLDNTTNWVATLDDGARRGDAELKAMSEIVGTLSDQINVGLMKFAKSGNNHEGEVRFHIREMNTTNKTRFKAILDYMNANALAGSDADEAGSSATANEKLMDGALRYFNGLGRQHDGSYVNNAGTNADRKDHQDNAVAPAYDPNPNPSGYTWAYDGANQSDYNAPDYANAGCAKNYIIFIGNGWTSQPEGSPTNLVNTAADLSTKVGRTFTPNTTQIYNDGTHFDEYARFMYQVGVPTNITDPTNSAKKLNNGITTYTIDVCKDACTSGQEPNQTALLKSVAQVGGGKYFQAKSSAAIKAAFATILAEIQAVNSVFASATLPISVNTQGTYENQVYIGVFRPDGDARQRWLGNLKEYKFGRYCDRDGMTWNSATSRLDPTAGFDKVLIDSTRAVPLTGTYSATDERVADDVTAPDCGYYTNSSGANVEKIPVKLYLADQVGYRAIDESGNTGFIDLSAKSYWTSDSAYWLHSPTASGSTSDAPDGPEVERGGAAQKARTSWASGRTVYTCLGNCLATNGTASEKTLSNNAFSTANADVTAALVAPSNAAVTVSLARVGNLVTATAASHSFQTGDTVTIAGATQSEYNTPANSSTSVTRLSGTQFTYAIAETPPQSGSGTVSATGGTTPISSIVLSGTGCTSGACFPGKTVTATMVTGAAPANPADIAYATKTYLQGSAVPLVFVSGFTNTYSVITPSVPASATDVTLNTGGNQDTGLSATFNAATNTFTLTKTNPTNANPAPKLTATNRGLAANATVAVSSASEPKYNGGSWVVDSNATNTTITLRYITYSGCNPCTNGTATLGTNPTDNITFTRTPGSTTVNVTRATTNAALVNAGTFSISDAAGNYTGDHVISYNAGVSTTVFSFSDNVTLGPVTSATTTTSITATSTGTSGGPTTNNLINWVRGQDIWENENGDDPAVYTDVRASVHGDVLHARPVMVNYGGTIGIVGFYGSNDGFLRAIAAGSGLSYEPAGRIDSHTDDGNEKWAFIPSEFLSYNKLSRAYLNGTSSSPLIRYPNQSCRSPATATDVTGRDYRWDGPITAYQSAARVYYATNASPSASDADYDANTNTCASTSPVTCYTRPKTTWIFAAMRRGGRALYAIDVSLPDAPKLMWHIDSSTSTGLVAPNPTTFSELGQTWSEPKVATFKGIFTRADGTTTVTNPKVLVFGAGYDAAVEDQPSGTARSVTMGRGVYVLEAETGQLVKLLQPPSGVTKYSFPADVNLLDIDNDLYIDRIYAADTNANIFRFDLNNATVSDINSSTYWTTYHVAKLGDVSDDGGNDARKIHFPPEVLPFKTGGTTKVMVLVGTGDREKPLSNMKTSTSVKSLSDVGGCSTYFSTGSLPYPVTGSCTTSSSNGCYSNSTYTYFGPRAKDYFYGIIDTGGATVVDADLKYVNSSTSVSPFDMTAAADAGYKGWKIRLKTDPDGTAGDTVGEEKAVNAAKVVGGVVYFASNVPVTPDTSAGICSNLGTAQGYAVSPFTGAPALNRDNSYSGSTATYTQADYTTKFTGGGLPPTVTAGVVTIGGTPYRFIIGSGGSGLTSASSVSGQRNIINLRGTRSRLYWSYGADN